MSSDTVDDVIAFEAGKDIAPCQTITVHKNWWQLCQRDPECSKSVTKTRQFIEVLIILSAD